MDRYHPIGQLTYAHSSVATEDRDYVYDTAWNLNWRTNSGLAQRFIVDNKNQLTNALGVKISYDLNGNVSDDRTLWYSWDDENQLVQVLDGFYLTLRTDFVYDGKGRLRKRMEYVKDPGPEPGPGRDGMEPDAIVHWVLVSETRYIYDGNRVIQERTSNNVPAVSYTRGTDLSGSLEGAGGIGGLLSRSHGYSSGNWTQHNYYHADGNGNITYLVDSTGGLAASYRYDPFGNLISKSGPLADANVYRFSSKELHVNSGLYYYLHRFYSPNWQRWVKRDPLGEEGGLNLYSFVRNDAINLADPLGLWQVYTTAGGEFTLLLGIGVGANLVLWDSEDPRNIGLHLYWGPRYGANAGVGTGVGFVADGVDGLSSCWDFNFGAVSVTGVQEFDSLYDPKGVELQIGPGAGVSYGHTTTSPWFTVGGVIDRVRDWWKRKTQK